MEFFFLDQNSSFITRKFGTVEIEQLDVKFQNV